jgi:hypothetical protein
MPTLLEVDPIFSDPDMLMPGAYHEESPSDQLPTSSATKPICGTTSSLKSHARPGISFQLSLRRASSLEDEVSAGQTETRGLRVAAL